MNAGGYGYAVTAQPGSVDYKNDAYGGSTQGYSSLPMLEQHGEFRCKVERGQRFCCYQTCQLRIYDGAGQEILIADQNVPERGTIDHTFKDVLGTEVLYSKLRSSFTGYFVEVHCPKGTKIASIEFIRNLCPCCSERQYFMNILNAYGTIIYKVYAAGCVCTCDRTVAMTIESAERNTDVGTITFSYPMCDWPEYLLSVPADMESSHKAIFLGAIAILLDLRMAKR